MSAPVPSRLAGRKAVVTGAGSGIGRAVAERFAAEGAEVAAAGRRAERLEETVAAIREAGGNAHAWVLDVRDAEAVRTAMERIAERLGAVHCLVNNAGIGGPNACAQPGEDRWKDVLATNLDGMFHCTREALRFMPDGGRIVNMSSVLGKFGVPGYTAYCTAKHGVIGFTKALALEVAPRGITANALCPGWTETEMAREGMELLARTMGVDYEEARRHALSQVPLGRIIEPAEVAALAAWIASEEASGFTGQAVNLCGGAAMW